MSDEPEGERLDGEPVWRDGNRLYADGRNWAPLAELEAALADVVRLTAEAAETYANGYEDGSAAGYERCAEDREQEMAAVRAEWDAANAADLVAALATLPAIADEAWGTIAADALAVPLANAQALVDLYQRAARLRSPDQVEADAATPSEGGQPS